jgi:hypothetical protein
MEISDALLRALLGAVLVLLYIGGWIAGVVFVSSDAQRRGLPGWQRALWLLLALVPMLGLTAYLYYYNRPAAPNTLQHTGTQPRLRITLPHAPAGLRGPELPRNPTMPVAAVRNVHVATAPVPAMHRASGQAPQAGSQPAALRLAVVEGPHSGQEFVVGALPAQIGRGAEALVRLDGDLGVSRRHAELYQQAGVLRLRDLRSAHGTLVNGFTINDKGLMPGDKIQVGHSLLVVRGSDGRR